MAVGETFALRRAVLREGRADAGVTLPEDAVAGAFHLGARAGGAVVGIVTLAPANTDCRPGAAAWRLRGMAVAPAERGRGVGRALHDEAVARVRGLGGEVLWAEARDTALGFYEGLGWRVEGEGFVAALDLPHHLILFELGGRRGR